MVAMIKAVFQFKIRMLLLRGKNARDVFEIATRRFFAKHVQTAFETR